MMWKKLLPFFFFVLILSACATRQTSEEPAYYDGSAVGYDAQAPGAPPADTASLYAFNSGTTANEFQNVDETASNVVMQTEPGEGVPAGGETTPQERLIIRTADLSIVVEDTETALTRVTQMAEENGGWVVNSGVYQYNETAKTGNITIRIPAEGFNSAMAAIRGLALEVTSESSSGQDVTDEYVDLNARLGNLEATADRVRSFLDDATKVEDALAVNAQLSQLEEQIEVIKGRMQYLSQSSSFSTITVNITPDVLSQPIEVGGWKPVGVAREAVEALVSALQNVTSGLIWIGLYVLPLVLLFGLPIWFVVRFVRRRWGRQPVAAVVTNNQ